MIYLSFVGMLNSKSARPVNRNRTKAGPFNREAIIIPSGSDNKLTTGDRGKFHLDGLGV